MDENNVYEVFKEEEQEGAFLNCGYSDEEVDLFTCISQVQPADMSDVDIDEEDDDISYVGLYGSVRKQYTDAFYEKARVNNMKILSVRGRGVAAYLEQLSEARLQIPGSTAMPIVFRQEDWRLIADPRLVVCYEGVPVPVCVPPVDVNVAVPKDHKYRSFVTYRTYPISPVWLVTLGNAKVSVIRSNGENVWKQYFIEGDDEVKDSRPVYNAMNPTSHADVLSERHSEARYYHPDNVRNITILDGVQFSGTIPRDMINAPRITKSHGVLDVMSLLRSLSSNDYLHARRFFTKMRGYGKGDNQCIRRMLAFAGFWPERGAWKYDGWVRLLTKLCPRVIDDKAFCGCSGVWLAISMKPLCLKRSLFKVLSVDMRGSGICTSYDHSKIKWYDGPEDAELYTLWKHVTTFVSDTFSPNQDSELLFPMDLGNGKG